MPKLGNNLKNVLLLVILLCTITDSSWLQLLKFVKAEENRDFYKILEIKRSAKERDIKKAFKKMSLKWHPDKNKGDDSALKKF